MTFGQRVKSQRQKHGITTTELAQAVSVSQSTVSRWENGEISHLRTDKLRPLADALRTTTSYLLGMVDDPDASATLGYQVEDGIKLISSPDEVINRLAQEAGKTLLAATEDLCLADVSTPSGVTIEGYQQDRIDVVADFIKDNKTSLRILISAMEATKKEK